MELKRPKKKTETAPLTEADRCGFFPYIPEDYALPSQSNSWKTDERAVALIEALNAGEDLRDTDWTGVNLKGADLSGKDLYGIRLAKAILTGVNFHGTNLECADLSYAYMEDTDLSEACLKDVNFKGVSFRNCRLDDADIDEKSLAYLHSIEFFIEQIESGKIDLKEIPQDQLNYLDLRMIDLTKVNIQDVDLSALVLDGVNLSGVRVDKRHLLNMALMAKIENRTLIAEKKSKQALDAMLQKISFERKEKLLRYSMEEKKKKQEVAAYSNTLKRPKLKGKVDIPLDDLKQTDETGRSDNNKQGATLTPRSLSTQKQKIKLQRPNTKKRS